MTAPDTAHAWWLIAGSPGTCDTPTRRCRWCRRAPGGPDRPEETP